LQLVAAIELNAKQMQRKNEHRPCRYQEQWTLRLSFFVDVPFGHKPDLKNGVVVDFDQIHNNAIKPAIEACRLEASRGDEERTGRIIHGRCLRGCC
jgi:hypothetical protein